eukprot:3065483-Amphidinium_carterae.1
MLLGVRTKATLPSPKLTPWTNRAKHPQEQAPGFYLAFNAHVYLFNCAVQGGWRLTYGVHEHRKHTQHPWT